MTNGLILLPSEVNRPNDLVNRIILGDCIDVMSLMPAEFVDLTVTSPPYDDLRTYTNDYKWDESVWVEVIEELYRVTKAGGVVVWVVGDATINGSETCTSFRQALCFKDIGFYLHDTMIYQKANFSNPSTSRYHQIFEYMFVFSKGRPLVFNPIKDRKNITTTGSVGRNSIRQKDGSMLQVDRRTNSEYGMRYNIWRMKTAGQENMGRSLPHPAMFPEQLANDHILSWSSVGDLVYDPFLGSGTTAKMAVVNGRRFVGSEISESYCKIAESRIKLDEVKGE